MSDGLYYDDRMSEGDALMWHVERDPHLRSTVTSVWVLKSIDFVASNLPGPNFPVYASGALVEQMFPFGPLAGAAVNVTLFSYDGRCHVGINTDRAAVPKLETFLQCMRAGFDEVLALAGASIETEAATGAMTA